MISDIISTGLAIIDKVIPDPAQKAAAKLKLLEAQQIGDLKEAEIQLSAIISESKSADPWTSRARPSFLYVIYIMILSSVPMGILFAVSPETAQSVTDGVKMWLAAIPNELYTLFGAGYLGYTGMRSWDKKNGKAT